MVVVPELVGSPESDAMAVGEGIEGNGDRADDYASFFCKDTRADDGKERKTQVLPGNLPFLKLFLVVYVRTQQAQRFPVAKSFPYMIEHVRTTLFSVCNKHVGIGLH